MNVLSLFDGMSCGLIAFTELGIPVDRYVAYEIDKYAIQTSKHNFPNIEQMGDVFKADFKQFEGFDMVIGGSPCTYWSIAQSADKREKEASGIGWELFSQFVRALKESKPKYFLYENNKSMSKEIRMSITETFGFEPIHINSALVSAQNRQRLYWVGKRNSDGTYSKVGVGQPEDRGILLKDILDDTVAESVRGMENDTKSRTLTASYWKTNVRDAFVDCAGGRTMVAEPINTTTDGKAQCLRATCYKDDIRNMVGNSVDKRTCVAECVSSRGVYSDTGTRSSKTSAGTEQHYEVRGGGKTNALTTVQKDNMVIKQIGVFPNNNGEVKNSLGNRVYSSNAKSVTLKANGGGGGAKTGLYAVPVNTNNGKSLTLKAQYAKDGVANFVTNGGFKTSAVAVEDKKGYTVEDGLITVKDKKYPIKLPDGEYIIRKLTVSECKRLQTVPEWYEFPVSNTQAYKMLGNGWTVDVIAHLFQTIKEDFDNEEN